MNELERRVQARLCVRESALRREFWRGWMWGCVWSAATVAWVFLLFGCCSAPRWPTCAETRIGERDSEAAFMVRECGGTVVVVPVEMPGVGPVTGIAWSDTPLGMPPCWWEERGFSPAGRDKVKR